MEEKLTERYRPEDLDQIVGQDKIISEIKSKIKGNKNPPHFLFYGKPGIGKTATAQAIATELNADFLEINGSEQRRIGDIREKVIPSMQHTWGGNKVILMDESDMLTFESQTALKRPLEKYQNVIMVFSCNDVSRMNEAIRSRCKEFKFTKIDGECIKKRLEFIAKTEHIDNNDIEKIAKESDGDLRKAINNLSEQNETEEIDHLKDLWS